MRQRRSWVWLTVFLLAGCGAVEAEPGDADAAHTSAPSATPAPPTATETATEEQTTAAATQEEEEEDATHLVFGGVYAPSSASLGPMDGDPKCMGYGPFSGIDEGMQVLIHGASDNIIAVTELGPAQWSDEHDECFWFYTTSVQAGEGFYSAEIEDFGKSLVVDETNVDDLLGLTIMPD